MENTNEIVQNLFMELRRGVIAIAVLSQLKKEHYGYSLMKQLSDQGLEVDQGTLYPLLRRLESQGLLQSDWRIVDDSRPRRYYVISPTGIEVLKELEIIWAQITSTMQELMFN